MQRLKLKYQIFIIVNYEGFYIWIEAKQLKILCLKILKKEKNVLKVLINVQIELYFIKINF